MPYHCPLPACRWFHPACGLICGSVAALAAELQPLPNSCENELARLQFKNRGVVRSEMRFAFRTQPCYYVETPAAWSCPWGKTSGGAGYPYLCLVDPTGDRTEQPHRPGDEGAPRWLVPPLGLRSAVPLGGLGAGTLELRADGSLQDWNIFNNSPGGGGGKVQLDAALFGLRVKPDGAPAKAWILRTQPPAGLPPISQIEYAGAFPVSRLRFADTELPLAVDLFAYGEFKIRDAQGSAAPAVIFSFNLCNPSAHLVEASVFFNLPNHLQGDFSSMEGLRLDRGGTKAASGSMAVRCGGEEARSWAVGDDFGAIWKAFAADGSLGRQPISNAQGRHGAVAMNCTLEPRQAKTLSLVLAWYFPHRTHAGGRQEVGNYYTKIYADAPEVAKAVLARLPATWEAIRQWQQLCFENSLPAWLQDALVNSVATMAKTGLWLADGRWRQWESFSCSALDPVHIDFYRSLPYALFFPELQRSQWRGFTSIQKPDGFINEDLGNSGRSMDSSQARSMGDCTSAFVLGVYHQYLWSGDRAGLDELWPHAKLAAQWQIQRSRRFGLPEHLDNTYDWWAFDRKDVVAYNAVMHLAALQAAAKLAQVEGDAPFTQTCLDHLESARKQLDALLWTGNYYRSWWMQSGGFPDALHADTLYGQLWASILGLGWVVDAEKVRAHLEAERTYNASPFGLKVMQRRGNDPVDELVWQAGSIDWAALSLYAGGKVKPSLAEAERVIDVWREHLRDPWDWRDLTRSDDGQPWCNSHYARQLMLWSIPLALSGQHYDAAQKDLSFEPPAEAPARLPWFTPQANGCLETLGERQFRFSVLSGRLDLRVLQIGKSLSRYSLSLAAGQSITLGP